MGQMRFLSPSSGMASNAVRQAYLAGWDGIPWPSHNQWDGRLFTIQRPTTESGSLQAPWVVEGYGELLLLTASLMEREKPYLLPVELRGAW